VQAAALSLVLGYLKDASIICCLFIFTVAVSAYSRAMVFQSCGSPTLATTHRTIPCAGVDPVSNPQLCKPLTKPRESNNRKPEALVGLETAAPDVEQAIHYSRIENPRVQFLVSPHPEVHDWNALARIFNCRVPSLVH